MGRVREERDGGGRGGRGGGERKKVEQPKAGVEGDGIRD